MVCSRTMEGMCYDATFAALPSAGCCCTQVMCRCFSVVHK